MLSPSSSLHFSSKRGEGVFIPRKDLSPRRSLASELSLRPPPAFNQIPEIKDGGSVGGAVCALDSVRKGGGSLAFGLNN